MLSTEEVSSFLRAQGITAPIFPEGEEPEMPDQVVTVGLLGGLSSTYEYLFDRPAIRIRVRGGQRNRASAEALAGQVDQAMLVPGSFSLAGKHVISLQRLSGPPGFVGLDSPNGRRAVLEASYIPEVQR